MWKDICLSLFVALLLYVGIDGLVNDGKITSNLFLFFGLVYCEVASCG